MIQIYSPNNTKFDMNGDMVLFPEICDTYSKLNGEWYMDLEHPLDEEGRWKYIVEEAVISAPTFMGKNQLFKIDKVTKTDTEIVAKAYPIFFDSADELFLYSCHPTSNNGQEALDIMTANSKYSGESNITQVSTAYFENRNFMECINGDDSPTFVKRWGGEVLYDNYKIIINDRVGGDYGAEIRYRKNQESISCDIDMSGMVTRIVPIAYNGKEITNKFVDSPNVDKYSKLYIRKMLFENVKMAEDTSDGEDESIIICASQAQLDEVLTTLCNEQFEAGADKPKVTIDVNMIDLTQTEKYKDFADLEKIGLGDTVKCYNKVLEITTEARCIILTWDCISNCVKKVVLGDYQYDYFTELQSSLEVLDKIIGTGNTIMAERIKGVLNAMNTQLRYQKTSAKKQDVRAIIFEDLDPESELYGALCLGTQGMQIANKRTEDNRDWEWTTAWTAHGGYANTLILGILTDKTGESFWNLDTGEMKLSGYATFKNLETEGETVINGGNINLETLFSRKITANDMKITGSSSFVSEELNRGVIIENGIVKLTSETEDDEGNVVQIWSGEKIKAVISRKGITGLAEYPEDENHYPFEGDVSLSRLRVGYYYPYDAYYIKITGNENGSGHSAIRSSSYGCSNYNPFSKIVMIQENIELTIEDAKSAGDGILVATIEDENYYPPFKTPLSVHEELTEVFFIAYIGSKGRIFVVPMSDLKEGETYNIYINGVYSKGRIVEEIEKIIRVTIIEDLPDIITVKKYDPFSISIKATGDNLDADSFDWYMSDDGITWENCSSDNVTFDDVNNISTFSVEIIIMEYDGKQFKCVVTGANGETKESNITKLIVGFDITITSNPSSIIVINGEDATFKVETSVSDYESDYVRYQWEYCIEESTTWMEIEGATNPSYTKKATINDNGNKYRCIISNSSMYVISEPATLTVVEESKPIIITKQPRDMECTVGDTVSFTITAESNIDAILSYQWQYKNPGYSSWSDATSGVSSDGTTYTTTPSSTSVNGQKRRCIVTDTEGNSVISNEVTLTVKEKPVEIVMQPVDATVVVGKTVTISIIAEGDDIAYQWQVRTGGNTGTWQTLDATNSDMIVYGDAAGIRDYRCIVTDSAGNEVISDVVTVTIIEEPQIIITQQPEDVEITVNPGGTTGQVGTSIFYVEAEGDGLSFQWQSNSGSSDEWKNISTSYSWVTVTNTETSSEYKNTMTTIGANGYKYRCVITDENGNVATSREALLTVLSTS